MKTAIFLGAGASAADGAPVQGQLFRAYFESLRLRHHFRHASDKDLVTFFYLMFNIDLDDDDLGAVIFPTFEEVLGILDLAVARDESFREFDLVNMAGNSGRINAIRLYLVILMAKVLKDALPATGPTIHDTLVSNLSAVSLLDKVAFFTTNYDLLLDNALINKIGSSGGAPINYAIPFFEPPDWTVAAASAINVYKIHGSLNWMYCSACNTIKYTPLEKGIVALYDSPEHCTCTKCEAVFQPLIVPPTFFKNMSNVFLTAIWRAAEQELRSIDHLVFCGYSFPDADLHVKYLLKRIQTSARHLQRVTVINHHTGKTSEQEAAEKNRFQRFLGPVVNYTAASITDFAANPSAFIL